MPTPSRSFARLISRFGPLLLWMSVIFFLSTDNGSSAHTRPVVHGLLTRLFGGRLSPALIDRIDWDIRKCAHVTEYSVLGLLLYRSIAFGTTGFRSRNIVLTILLGVLYAASDEFHQSFVPSRGASAADVFMDSYGVLVGTILSLWRWCVVSSRNAQ